MGKRSELRELLDTVKNEPLTRSDFTDLHFVDGLSPAEQREIIDGLIGDSAMIVNAWRDGENARGRQLSAAIAARYDKCFDDALSGGRAERQAALNAMNERELATEICGRGIAS